MTDWKSVAAAITRSSGRPFKVRSYEAVGGGCINQAARITDGELCYFIKLNRAERLAMFEAEAAGLAELHETCTLRVPLPVCVGVTGADSYLVTDDLMLGGRLDGAEAGRRLAALHQHTAQAFGWHRDNSIGATPQHNPWTRDWVTFWREQRLGFQLALAARNGHARGITELGDDLKDILGVLLDHQPAPSLLHGDLWGGNIAGTQTGEPAIFDPAVYYGDREADLAMTELFGGFPNDFYAAYRESWPLSPGYATRKQLYNLYHVLNHLNLFGSGYLEQARSMMERLLAEVR